MWDEVEKGGSGPKCNAPCPRKDCDRFPCNQPPDPGRCAAKCYLTEGHQYKDPSDPDYSPNHACIHDHEWR
jgi:hypothetical protein